MPEDYTRKLQTLLRKLFQFESADLDFGIYRIMNRKRDVIEKFIEKDLIASVDTEFGRISATTKASVKKELDELKTVIDKTLGSSALLPSGDFNPRFVNTPIGADLAKQYKDKAAAYSDASVSNEHKAEVFNHIYQFFSRYYDNGDFMSMRRYSAKQKFSVPYNGEEVLLHWANKDQYYIKTGEYFFNYIFRIGEYTIRFQIVQAETAMNNTKAENRFFVLNAGEGNVTYEAKLKELVILFEYRVLTESEKASVGTRNVQDALNEQTKTEVLAAVPDAGLKAGLAREKEGKIPLAKHLATYSRRNTSDYFIHKDLSGFLTQDLDFYIKNEMFDLDDLGTNKEVPVEQYLNRVRVMKAISLKIIAFLAQIEDFQKKLFEKKKFVLSANYCMTLDRVRADFYLEVAKNTAQIAEWKALYGIGEPGGQATLTGTRGDIIDEEFLKSHPYLVLDTRFFPQEFKDRLLATFDNLDDVTSGLMVKSENWQALNLLQERYREQVKCIYIDPPYNLGGDEFIYKDNYQHSCWLSMMNDRISKSYSFLNEKGTIFSNIDDCEIHELRALLNAIFNDNNFIDNIIWKKRYGGGAKEKFLVSLHEYILYFAKNIERLDPLFIPLSNKSINRYYTSVDEKVDTRGPYRTHPLEATKSMGDRGNLIYSIPAPDGTEIWPKRQWLWQKERSFKASANNELEFIKGKDGWTVHTKQYLKDDEGKTRVAKEFSIIDDVFTQHGTNEILDCFNEAHIFSFPKPTALLVKLFQFTTFQANKEIILDYFAGSGTTAHAILKLNLEDKGDRKYILIEMAEYFDTVMKPRIQKIMYSNKWKDGKPQNNDGISHMFKYLTLEQYEDTLNNIEFQEDGTVQKTLGDMEGYVLRYMLDFETRESPCRMNTTKLERPFDYKLRITKDSEMHDETVDLVETFNYLLGLKVKRVRTFAENGTTYRVVHGETLAGQETTAIWRTITGLDLKQDKKFIEEKILIDPKLKAERVFINGDFHVEGALPIEPEFQRLMGA
jgi:adenine-specific DNA-methyltransferase